MKNQIYIKKIKLSTFDKKFIKIYWQNNNKFQYEEMMNK